MERIAIVGSRHGADLSEVVRFIDSLYAKQPDTLLVSGGAIGVDQMAESSWFRLGGRIRSYRPTTYDDGFGVEVWEYGGQEKPFVSRCELQGIQLVDYRSAALYRNTLIAEDCDRLVCFYRPMGGGGTAQTEAWARDAETSPRPAVDVHVFVAKGERNVRQA